jgi:hypothetical protein
MGRRRNWLLGNLFPRGDGYGEFRRDFTKSILPGREFLLARDIVGEVALGPGVAPSLAGSVGQENTLSLYKEGWQLFLAHYLWISGPHLIFSQPARFTGSTVAGISWYALGPHFHCNVISSLV